MCHARVQDDRNLVIYRADGSPIWATNSAIPAIAVKAAAAGSEAWCTRKSMRQGPGLFATAVTCAPRMMCAVSASCGLVNQVIFVVRPVQNRCRDRATRWGQVMARRRPTGPAQVTAKEERS